MKQLDTPFSSLTAAREWFANQPFNLAIDYWTFVPYRPYGSGATRENILPVLKKLRPGFLQIYAKGETGHTSFRSSLQCEHPMLSHDLLKFYRQVTRETGTKLFLYWSGLEDGVCAQRHPEWRLLDAKSQPVKFFPQILPPEVEAAGMCPQSPFFDEWVSVQLREVFALADPDGMWIDGTWMPACYCARCVGRFRKEAGFQGEIPEGLAWTRYWAKVLYEYRKRFLAFCRSLKPTFLVSFGNITVREEFREDRDWCSGDWYTPNNHRLQQSISMRRYTTTGLPSEAWICDTQMVHTMLKLRARSKTLERVLQEGAGILANGGSWTYWTFPMPNGAVVPSRMRMAAAAAKFARARKHVSLHTHSASWTAILDLQPNARLWENNVWGAGKALIHLHRSPDLIEESSLSDDMPYDLVVIPEQPLVSKGMVAKLEAFVRHGGKLLCTGSSITSPELQKLLGVKLVQSAALEDGHIFRKNGDPTGVYAPWDKLALDGARELYPLYRSWDDDNPRMKIIPPNIATTGLMDEENPQRAGFPAATVRKLGRGLAVHIPTSVFHVYWCFGYPDIKAWLKEILDFLQPRPLFRTDAQSFVEVALRKKKNALLVHFVNGNPGRDLSHINTNDLWVEDIPAVGPIRSWIRCEKKPKRVTWEPGGQAAKYTYRNGVAEIVLPRLEIHTCLVIEPWRIQRTNA
jgi:hypothetical protein